MALFKTQEEQQAKQEEKIQQVLSKYGLNELKNEEDINSVRKIAADLVG